MNKIKVMSDVLANKIAAGEIIERPISVVKELVENAIDAKADVIEISLLSSGLELIRVSDNGIGMSKEDLKNCVKRHATSKLYSDEELFNISTLGFRGEALASILVVSELKIESSLKNGEAFCLLSNDQHGFDISKSNIDYGTIVSVSNLFYNTPVRYKHLSNLYYELSLITNFIQKTIITQPNLKIVLKNDDKLIIESSGNNITKDAFFEVYGLDVARDMIASKDSDSDFEVEVFFANPKHTRSKKNFITIEINERIIRNYRLEGQILESFKQYLHTNQYPILLLKLKLDYSLVDVNIHPTKQQVNISMIEKLCLVIDRCINKALNQLVYIPSVVIDKLSEDVVSIDDYVKNEDSGFKKDVVKKQNEFDFSISYSDEKVKWKLPVFDYIGTLSNTYLLFENKEGMHLVDQHAAQERINYEKIMDKFKNKKFHIQHLVVPILIDVTKSDIIDAQNKLGGLKQLGINAYVFGDNKIKIDEVDNFYLNAGNLQEDIFNMLKLVNKKLDFSKLYEDVAIMMSCKSSIKAHDYINKNDIDDLLYQLNECVMPYTCPHGRPIIINISNYEIEKLFKRV